MKQVIQKILSNRYALFALVLIANIAYVALLASVLPIRYEENDDIMMAMIANGSYSGAPDYHLVYINVIYGYVLTLLYGWTSAVEWYTLSFMVLHVLSMSFLSYCILTTPNRARWEKGLWLFCSSRIYKGNRLLHIFFFVRIHNLVVESIPLRVNRK